MEKFLLRTIINGFALWAAVKIVPGIQPDHLTTVSWFWLILIFGVMNALVKPLIKLLSCGLIFLTLGLFTLIINTLMLYITDWVSELFGFGLTITNFWWALLGALIISVISFILSMVFKDELKGKKIRVKR